MQLNSGPKHLLFNHNFVLLGTIKLTIIEKAVEFIRFKNTELRLGIICKLVTKKLINQSYCEKLSI